MNRRDLTIALALLVAAASAAQEKMSTVDIRVRVSSQSGAPPLPDNIKVEIAGHEAACGDLNDEPRSKPTAHGEAHFADVPACKVTVRVFVSGYKGVTHPVDLAEYKGPIAITLVKEE